MSGHATHTLDIVIAVAFMLTLKMDEEALDRCIEKTLWCMSHFCRRKQRVTTYAHRTCDATHARIQTYSLHTYTCIDAFVCVSIYECTMPFVVAFVSCNPVLTCIYCLQLLAGTQWRRSYTLVTCRI